MTTTFNRDQVLQLTRETIDNTLRFFNTVNENLIGLAKTARDVNVPRMEIDEISRICTAFHRDHEVRMNHFNTICQDFTNTARKHIPTTTPILFDTKEIVRINREAIDTAMRFFDITIEAMTKCPTDHQLPRNVIETIDRAVVDFQKTHADFIRTFEKAFENVLKTVPVNETSKLHTDRIIETTKTHHEIRDEVLLINRDMIKNTLGFFVNIHDHVGAILENSDKKNIEIHAEKISTHRNDFIRINCEIIERFHTITRRTVEAHTGKIEDSTPLFDHQEVVRINHDAIRGMVKYFTTITEHMVHPNADRTEALVRETKDFQRLHRVLTNRIESIWCEAVNRSTKTIKPCRIHEEPKVRAAGEETRKPKA